MYKGTIIKESLQDESVLETIAKNNMRTATIDHPAPDQPSLWTLYDFEIEDNFSNSIAQILSQSLKKGTWYVDMNNGKEYYVIFKGKILKREKGDITGIEKAKKYARSLGIPESQIGWKND